jgi:hypothetical protein
MTLQVFLYKGAVDFYGHMVKPGVVESVLHECGTDPLAAEFLRNFGVHEYQFAIVKAILQQGPLPVHEHLKLLLFPVIKNLMWVHLVILIGLIQFMRYFRKYVQEYCACALPLRSSVRFRCYFVE